MIQLQAVHALFFLAWSLVPLLEGALLRNRFVPHAFCHIRRKLTAAEQSANARRPTASSRGEHHSDSQLARLQHRHPRCVPSLPSWCETPLADQARAI